ncbi:MAG TPA: hypothetical protein DEA28_01245 [Firmicutes bacterium]|nr:hypothetical protein [Bacillota bacterium]
MKNKILIITSVFTFLTTSLVMSCNNKEPVNEKIEVQSINLIASKTAINIGESIKLIVEINPINASIKSTTFESSNNEVLYVTNDGVITGISNGQAEITCKVTSNNGEEFIKKLTFEVKEVAVTGIKITNTSLDLALNSKTQLNIEFTPENVTNKKVTYVSDNSSVISIDQTGMMTALSIGKANITVRTDSGSFEDTLTFNVVSEYTKTLNDQLNKLNVSKSIESNKGSSLKIIGQYQKKGMTTQYSESTNVDFYSNFINISTSTTQKINDDKTKNTSKTFNGVDIDHSRYFNFSIQNVNEGFTEDDLNKVKYEDIKENYSLDNMKENGSLYYLKESDSYGLLNVIRYYSTNVLDSLKLNEDNKIISNNDNGFEIKYAGLTSEYTARYADISLKVTINSDNSIKEIHYLSKIYKKSDLDENNLPKADAKTNEYKDYTYTMTYSDSKNTYNDDSFSPKMFYFTKFDIKTFYTSSDLDNHKYFAIGNTISFAPINFTPTTASSSIDNIEVTKIENENNNDAVELTSDGLLKARNLGKSKITFRSISGLEITKEVEVIDKNLRPNSVTELTVDGESKYVSSSLNLTVNTKHVVKFKFYPESVSQDFTTFTTDKDVVINIIEGGFEISRISPTAESIYVYICGAYDFTQRLRFNFQ